MKIIVRMTRYDVKCQSFKEARHNVGEELDSEQPSLIHPFLKVSRCV